MSKTNNTEASKSISSDATDQYVDPPNSDALVARFKGLSTSEEAHAFLEDVFPGWLIASTDSYSGDYEFLQNNWRVICERTGVERQRIIIVDAIFFDKKENVKHNLLMHICEEMTRRGYVVRRKEELTGCTVCHKAIPTQNMWAFMREKQLPVPTVWKPRCTGCVQQ